MPRRLASRRVDLAALSLPALLRHIHREDRRVFSAVERALPQIGRAVDMVVASLRRGGRLIYVGAGTSGRLALLDALEIPPTFGVSPRVVQAVLPGSAEAPEEQTSGLEDDEGLGRAEMRRVRVGRRDVVVGITASGTTPFTLAAVAEARRRGARTIALTMTPGSALTRRAHLAIVADVGEEVLRGSTRMKAGTAQKLILTMLSTAAMVRLGHVYKDLMVGVRPLNEKLRRRLEAIVAVAAGASQRTAARALHEARGQGKVAVVMVKGDVPAATARRLLEEGSGVIEEALRQTGRTPEPRVRVRATRARRSRRRSP